MKKLQWFVLCINLGVLSAAHAFNWHDLWHTPDAQAQRLMNEKRYKEAAATFKRSDWRATAAFRAEDFKTAAQLYSSLNQADDYYNAGNAFAYLGDYQRAIAAYDKALAMNKQHADATYNRHIIEELLKQQQQEKKQQADNKQSSPQEQPSKNDQNQSDNNGQQKQDPSQSKPQQDKPAENPAKQDQSSPNHTPSDPKQSEQSSKTNDKPEETNDEPSNSPANSKPSAEQQQAKEQWLNMIPDDPGGLLREKFLRDYLRRRGEL